MKTLLMMMALVVAATVSGSAEASTCEVELQNGRGMVLDTFYGYGYDRIDACSEARMDCRRAIRAGYYRGRVLNCVETRPMRRVTRSCDSRLVGPRGRTIEYFVGTATGRRGTGVKREACANALRQCHRYQSRTGRYRATCITDRRGGRDIRRPHPTPRPRPIPPRRGGRRTVILDA